LLPRTAFAEGLRFVREDPGTRRVPGRVNYSARSRAPRKEPRPFLRHKKGWRNRLRVLLFWIRRHVPHHAT